MLETFITENLLTRKSVQQDVYIAARRDGAGGSGTIDDPYNGANFDQVMGDPAKVPPGTTVRLGPGVFVTKGYNVARDGTTLTGWKPRSGQRIIGGGTAQTTVKVSNGYSTGPTYAFGMDPSARGDYLMGFELEDLTIDCNVDSNTTGSVGGVGISGQNIRLRRVKVVNFGTTNSTITCRAISLATANQGVYRPSDAVADECQVLKPSKESVADATVVALHLGSADQTQSSNQPAFTFHEFCVFRNCLVDCSIIDVPSPGFSLIGFCVSGGRGTIIENNRIRNCAIGGRFHDGATSTLPSKDVILRENSFEKVVRGLVLSMDGSSKPVGRIVVDGNRFETSDANPALNVVNTGSAANLGAVVIRRNQLEIVSGAVGILVKGATRFFAVENLLSMSTTPTDIIKGIQYQSCTTVTVMDNRSFDGQLIRGYSLDTNTKRMEWAVEAEDWWLAV